MTSENKRNISERRVLLALLRKILDAAVRARRFWRRHRPRRLSGASGEANGASQRLTLRRFSSPWVLGNN